MKIVLSGAISLNEADIKTAISIDVMWTNNEET